MTLEIPKGLVEAVVGLVGTGPVPLGGYTLAEIDAVSGVIHFLEREPPAELVAEAVRSLAARSLITTVCRLRSGSGARGPRHCAGLSAPRADACSTRA